MSYATTNPYTGEVLKTFRKMIGAIKDLGAPVQAAA